VNFFPPFYLFPSSSVCGCSSPLLPPHLINYQPKQNRRTDRRPPKPFTRCLFLQKTPNQHFLPLPSFRYPYFPGLAQLCRLLSFDRYLVQPPTNPSPFNPPPCYKPLIGSHVLKIAHFPCATTTPCPLPSRKMSWLGSFMFNVAPFPPLSLTFL